ncbi:hypothetical protein NQ317_017587 [Molorchus minor]|uniref:ascorbate ferrireductase (transmembrane) n=1 Tax=Molorchus minor TaxID=1323400 RepID=A0ABQ9JQW1_9CUCU|nr:hypothetical protein NQ317_017587 [Molorchus minor]
MESTLKEKTLRVADLLHQQLIAVFFILILWEVLKNYDINSVGTWHIILSTFGPPKRRIAESEWESFAVCMVEAILMFKADGPLRGYNRVSRGMFHGACMFLGCASITAGVSLKIYQKNENNIAHFTTTHGKLGGLSKYGTVSYRYFSVDLNTSVCHWRSIRINRPRISSSIRLIWVKLFHNLLGIVTYVVGVVALGYGLNYIQTYTGENGRITLLVFLVCFVSYSLVGPIVSVFNTFSK